MPPAHALGSTRQSPERRDYLTCRLLMGSQGLWRKENPDRDSVLEFDNDLKGLEPNDIALLDMLYNPARHSGMTADRAF